MGRIIERSELCVWAIDNLLLLEEELAGLNLSRPSGSGRWLLVLR